MTTLEDIHYRQRLTLKLTNIRNILFAQKTQRHKKGP